MLRLDVFAQLPLAGRVAEACHADSTDVGRRGLYVLLSVLGRVDVASLVLGISFTRTIGLSNVALSHVFFFLIEV